MFSNGGLTDEGRQFLRQNLSLYGYKGNVDKFIASVEESLYFKLELIRIEKTMDEFSKIHLAVDTAA